MTQYEYYKGFRDMFIRGIYRYEPHLAAQYVWESAVTLFMQDKITNTTLSYLGFQIGEWADELCR